MPLVAAAALFSAVSVFAWSGPALAKNPARHDSGTTSTTYNFTVSSESGDSIRRPKKSLAKLIRQARAGRAVIEPAALPIRSRALTPADSEIQSLEVPETLVPEVRDPLEPVNRLVFAINEVVDRVVLTPVSTVYRTIVPAPLRVGVENALYNFASPVILANDLLQGRPDRARTTFVRFVVNSTAGVGGLGDPAAAAGLPRHTEDFGQTLAVWGTDSGPYLVLPILGPSNLRDGVGLVADTFMHPATWLMWNLSFVERTSPVMAYTVSSHEALMDEAAALRRTSPDFYATVRDIYAQKRASDIANGDAGIEPLPPIPSE
jgi:phospholipid-binding lipoprotein MlaA